MLYIYFISSLIIPGNYPSDEDTETQWLICVMIRDKIWALLISNKLSITIHISLLLHKIAIIDEADYEIT